MLLFIHVLAKCWSRCELITKKNSRDKDWVQPDMKKAINWIETNKEAGVLRYVMHFRATLNHRYTIYRARSETAPNMRSVVHLPVNLRVST